VVTRICAVDAAYLADYVVAVASMFDNSGRLVEKTTYSGHSNFPYTSGLFYLREGPFVIEAVRKLSVRPELICFDAHGMAHPRYAGLAVVTGMILSIPSIGIAKSLLVGRVYNGRKGTDRIMYNGKTIGFVTSMQGSKRYWSPGYSVGIRSLESLVRQHADICLQAMSESHRTSRELVRVHDGDH